MKILDHLGQEAKCIIPDCSQKAIRIIIGQDGFGTVEKDVHVCRNHSMGPEYHTAVWTYAFSRRGCILNLIDIREDS